MVPPPQAPPAPVTEQQVQLMLQKSSPKEARLSTEMADMHQTHTDKLISMANRDKSPISRMSSIQENNTEDQD